MIMKCCQNDQGDESEVDDEEAVDREGSLVQEYFPGHVEVDQKSGIANLSTRSLV